MTELEELQEAAKDAGESHFGIYDLPEGWKEVDEGIWEDNGKYQYNTTVVSKNDKFFAIDQSRSGSYFSDWYYNGPEIYEVERHEETVVRVTWKPMK
jgi:hypothetical protein